ncbi:MAG: aldo/keto reductase [Chloroflexi bacterium]|nr:aldo/keto reductase [Chloroflexota bacterium]MDA1175067.1 aldo/keto reductase [Chloroflexota bacterium]
MNTRPFGKLGTVSALTLGGGGLGQLWGTTTRDECIATAREAPELGITLLDMAPSYGNGEAESVIGETFNGSLPEGVRITTKCRVGDIPPADIAALLEESINTSLERMKLDHVDVFFLHNWVTADGAPTYDRGTPRSSVESAVIPAMERIVASGRARAWGLTGIGDPAVLIDMLDSGIKPDFIQIMANLLDSPGGLKYPDGSAQPRNIIAAAQRAGASIMGIRAVQAGALTSEIDRFKPADNPETLDFQRAAPFRAIAAEVGLSPAFLAHQYALSMDGPATVVLGVKNRTELRECVAAEAAGPMDPGLMQRIDQAVERMD